MKGIPLQQIPNQSFSIALDGNQWGFLLKSIEGVTYVSLSLNGVDILDSARAVSGGFIIPAQYQENGNFMFVNTTQQLPYYPEFTVSQSLVYFSASDLSTVRTMKTPPVTASDFNPLGALPLRFAPQGYT